MKAPCSKLGAWTPSTTMPQLKLRGRERDSERARESEGESVLEQSQKVNRNHNSDNFIYNTLEELYFIYSFKCDDEAAEPRAERPIRMDRRYQGPVPALYLSPSPLSHPIIVCVFVSMKSLGPLLCQSRVGTGLETLLRFGSRCVYKLLKSVCILTYEYHVVPRGGS